MGCDASRCPLCASRLGPGDGGDPELLEGQRLLQAWQATAIHQIADDRLGDARLARELLLVPLLKEITELKPPPTFGDLVPVARHVRGAYRKRELSQARIVAPVDGAKETALTRSAVGRSKSNTGREGATAPPQMAGLKDRLKRALDKLNEERKKVGLPEVTQKELAAESGLSQSVISEYLGKAREDKPLKESFTAATLARLCLALGADVNFVLIGDGDVVPKLARKSATSLMARGAPPIDQLREESAPAPGDALQEPPAGPIAQPTLEHTEPKRVGRTPPTP